MTIGNHAGWALRFERTGGRPLTISSATYGATISATLPSGFDKGEYQFVVDGLTDADHRTIAGATTVRLYLFWRDANASVAGYLAGVTGISDVLAAVEEPPTDALVAVLAPVKVAWKPGAGRYLTVIDAVEHAYLELGRPLEKAPKADTAADAAREIAKDLGIDAEAYAAPAAAQAPKLLRPAAGAVAGAAVIELGERLEELTGSYGRGPLLVRDGKLHIGARPIPLAGSEPEPLDVARGLLHIEPGALRASGRRVYTLTLKGRPDLKPGDVARFETPPAAVAGPGPQQDLAGALLAEVRTIADVLAGPAAAGASTDLYVSSVKHTLNGESGFVTVLAGVTLHAGDSPWDDAPGEPDPGANAVVSARDRVRALTREALARLAPPEVAEVRAANTSGTAEPPHQTLTVWRGTEGPDGYPHGSRRFAIRDSEPDAVTGTSYATPFAWGRCGLVLPRYPGTRVALLHRAGRPDDPIDVGALWPAGAGPDSQPGDWWLILPVGVPQADRASVADDKQPDEHKGKATNDLIDADGNRVIEAGELTIRVGRDAKLTDAGARPPRGEQDAVTIEHAEKGSKIVMKSDGSIVIEANAALKLKAGTNIELSADNVKVSVKTAMEVT